MTREHYNRAVLDARYIGSKIEGTCQKGTKCDRNGTNIVICVTFL